MGFTYDTLILVTSIRFREFLEIAYPYRSSNRVGLYFKRYGVRTPIGMCKMVSICLYRNVWIQISHPDVLLGAFSGFKNTSQAH